MIANIHHAKTHLSKLIERAEAGEEVIIARAGKPAVRLMPIDEAPADPAANEGDGLPSWVGSLRGQIWIAPEMDAVEAEIAREMEDGAASS
jgi:prevent-host-death family protein